MSLLCGIFVGGASRRMGGSPKGLLLHPATGQPLALHLASLATQAGLACVLVGQRPEYSHLGLPMLEDRPPGIGPLGGLLALLEAASDGALALSCDLPYVTLGLLRRLLAAAAPELDVVAPQRGGRWEPLCAVYRPSVLPVLRQAVGEGERSFQRLLLRLRVAALPLSAEEHRQLDDWDCPQDLARGPHS